MDRESWHAIKKLTIPDSQGKVSSNVNYRIWFFIEGCYSNDSNILNSFSSDKTFDAMLNGYIFLQLI